MPRHIRKGDLVIVTAGNDKGATGEVLRIVTKTDRVVVSGRQHAHQAPQAERRPIRRAERCGGRCRSTSATCRRSWTASRRACASRAKPDGSKDRVAVRNGKELHTLRGPNKKKP